MKNLTKFFLGLLLTGIVLTGCKEATEIMDVTVYADYETEFYVVVDSSTSAKSGIDGTFNISETIDPNSDPDYKKYVDKIKAVEVTEVSSEILEINKEVMLETMTIMVFNPNHNATWQFTNEPIAVGTILTLDNASGQWDAIENILLDKEVFTVSLVGQTDQDGVEFKILFRLNSVIVASPLD